METTEKRSHDEEKPEVEDRELRLRREVDPDWNHGDPVWHMDAVTSGGDTASFRLVGDLSEVRRQREARRGQRA